MRKVAFDALIKDIKTRSVQSGDKVTRILIEFDSTNKTEILNELNYLQKGDRFVSIGIVEIKDG